ncbi:MAG: calcium-binding protein [Rhizobiaceae bacterium]
MFDNKYGLETLRAIEGFAADSWRFTINNVFASFDLFSDNRNDTLYGLGGDDELQGRGGNDFLDGGTGDDIIWGGTGNDVVVGGENDDAIYGNNDDDYLIGGSGVDYLFGGQGNDVLNGGAGADFIIGGSGTDSVSYEDSGVGVRIDLGSMAAQRLFSALNGEAEGDFLEGITGLIGSAGNDTLTGSDLANTISGRFGSDTIQGGLGADILDGGANIDTVSYSLSNAGVTVALNSLSVQSGGHANGDVLSNFENVIGSAYADSLLGSSAENVMSGGAGNDLINGDGGNDKLDGGTGVDTLNGGTGDDTISSGDGADTVIGGLNFDIVNYSNFTFGVPQVLDDSDFVVSINLVTGTAREGVLITDPFDPTNVQEQTVSTDTLTGIEGAIGGLNGDFLSGDNNVNRLEGGAGDDRLFGLGGNDTLEGGAGSDNLSGGAGADVLNGGNGNGVDFARYDDANHGDLSLRLDNATLNTGAVAVGDTYAGIEGLVGGLGNDVVIGNASANSLFGVGGIDFIDGREGNDTLNGGAGADKFRMATALNAATNVDTITDFVHGSDDILLLQSIFASIGATLDATELRLGTAAADANDHIIYNSANGQLFYDANGNGAGGQTLFARVTAGTVLDVGDFAMA